MEKSVSSPATCNGFKPESWTGGGVYVTTNNRSMT